MPLLAKIVDNNVHLPANSAPPALPPCLPESFASVADWVSHLAIFHKFRERTVFRRAFNPTHDPPNWPAFIQPAPTGARRSTRTVPRVNYDASIEKITISTSDIPQHAVSKKRPAAHPPCDPKKICVQLSTGPTIFAPKCPCLPGSSQTCSHLYCQNKNLTPSESTIPACQSTTKAIHATRSRCKCLPNQPLSCSSPHCAAAFTPAPSCTSPSLPRLISGAYSPARPLGPTGLCSPHSRVRSPVGAARTAKSIYRTSVQ